MTYDPFLQPSYSATVNQSHWNDIVHSGRSAQPRSQPAALRAVERTETPHTVDEFGRQPNPAYHRQYYYAKTPQSWANQLDLTGANTCSGTIEIESNLAMADGLEHYYTIMGNSRPDTDLQMFVISDGTGSARYNRIMHDDAWGPRFDTGDDHEDACDAVRELMPLVFARIGQAISENWSGQFARSGSTDALPFTILQVLGTDISENNDDNMNTAYCRIFQPQGASNLNGVSQEWMDKYPILCFHGCPSNTQANDILVVPIQQWVGEGFMLDAVRTQEGALYETIRLPHEGAVMWDITADDLWRFQTDSGTDASSLLNGVVDVCYGRSGHLGGNDGMIHSSKAHAFNNFVAQQMLASEVELSGQAMGASIPQDEFIQAWRDRRIPKVIDRASPFSPHYHDEIRCSKCNGRTIIKLPPDNKMVEADCGHCAGSKTIQFPHLTSVKTDTVKAVGDTP